MSPRVEKHPGCIQACLEVMGDKWTPLILRDLSLDKAKFSDLETSLEGISPRTLSQRLDKLAREEIVEKSLYCERPPRYTYELTPKGRELQDILVKMSDWGARHNRYQNFA